MKIDYSNFPFLKDIEDGTLEHFDLLNYDAEGGNLCLNLLKKVWADIAPKIRANICYPCKTYLEAIQKSSGCFDRLMKDAMGYTDDTKRKEWVDSQELRPITEEEMQREERIYDIIGNSYGCYILSLQGEMLVYAFGKDSVRHLVCFEMVMGKVIRCFVQADEDYAYFVTNEPSVASVLREISDVPIEIIAQMQHEMQMIVMFERYAKIETRFFNPNTKARLEFTSMTPAVNTTRCKVNIRDSKYFTEFIRNKEFLVSGHLRLQPKKKNGEWTRELIYIDSFKKHGYHRRAAISK